jgi:hypothetical protein
MLYYENRKNMIVVRFEAFTAVTMKNVIFWDVALLVLVLTDVLEERIASIFRVEKSASEEPVWPGGCRLSHQLEITSYMGSEQSETECRPSGKPTVEWGGVLGLC